ncbi:exodeoxyribonuclease I [Pelagibaculum spongiae]|uniref:Exodeoxyribonuclease I n=1 Tax=Pelagibaculum spongiae TaxID=2080658 RepID=A0A2V1GUY9_9GAMM|nr:exodeoxyribonuclease I [Pelagibaculum spongiae]PVZ69501.1 exodeoxyribonuclease I [Pelagibaculum spongiae]
MGNTLYWHDYETFGAKPSQDRPVQFAGIRTDENLNIVGEPLMIYCQPPQDRLPHPIACKITGITPQMAAEKGLSEIEFIQRIEKELALSGTCGVGYNSIRFDDEVTRHALYRNFFDPYAREWQNGNSRWDIIDMVRLCYALKPETLVWPEVDGKVSMKLDQLAPANGIGHADAHDALADVRATIELAKKIKTVQPRLYDYCYGLRFKRKVAELIDLKNCRPMLHISGMFGRDKGFAALTAPIAKHPENPNGMVLFDLTSDPQLLFDLPAEEIARRLYTPAAELSENEPRVPLKTVHLNRSPVLLPAKMLDQTAAERLNIDRQLCQQHWQKLTELLAGNQQALWDKLKIVFSHKSDKQLDPEQQLYSGGFFNTMDKRLIDQVHRLSPESLRDTPPGFQDARLPEMLFRYRARNWPETLTEEEQLRWQAWCRGQLLEGDFSMQDFQAALNELEAGDPLQQPLAEWAQQLSHNAGLSS